MNTMRKFVLIMIALSLPLTQASAAVYKSVGPDGKITYSDQTREGAERIDFLPTPSPAPPAAPALPVPISPIPAAQPDATPPLSGTPDLTSPPAAQKPIFAGYREFSILSPENDAAVRENSGKVDILLALEPAFNLEAGHKISVLLDGRSVIEGAISLQLSLDNVDRGTHFLQALVSDFSGAVLVKTPTVIFHLKRVSILMLDKSPLLAPRSNISTPLAFPRAPQ